MPKMQSLLSIGSWYSRESTSSKEHTYGTGDMKVALSLDQEDALERAWQPLSILAWRIQWTRKNLEADLWVTKNRLKWLSMHAQSSSWTEGTLIPSSLSWGLALMVEDELCLCMMILPLNGPDIKYTVITWLPYNWNPDSRHYEDMLTSDRECSLIRPSSDLRGAFLPPFFTLWLLLMAKVLPFCNCYICIRSAVLWNMPSLGICCFSIMLPAHRNLDAQVCTWLEQS